MSATLPAVRCDLGVHVHLCDQPPVESGQMIFAVEPGLRSAIRSELRHRQGEAWPSRRVAVIEATSKVFRIGRGMAEALAVQLGEIEADLTEVPQ